MLDGVELRDWLGYDITWLLLGLLCVVLVAGWYAFVFISTRHKPQRSLNTLTAKPYTPPDLTALKAKYIALIEEINQHYTAQTISARAAHQKLSYVLRMFAYETRGHRVDTLTLADLQKTHYEQLTVAIGRLYLPEFARVQQGNVLDAVAFAREVVEGWN